jgi:hypothetical protein
MKKVFLVLFAAALFTMTAWAQGTSSPAGATAQTDSGSTTAKKHHHRKHRKHRKHHKGNSQ